MRKSLGRYLIYALFLSLLVLGGSGIGGIFDGSNATHASTINSSGVISIKLADLKPTSLDVTLGECYHGSMPSLLGRRRANFYYKVRNIGGTMSPNFFIIITNQASFLGGGGSPTLIPGGQYVAESYGTYVPTGGQNFKLTVYPLDALYYQIGGSWSSHVNWALDFNPNNNVIEYKIDIPTCS